MLPVLFIFCFRLLDEDRVSSIRTVSGDIPILSAVFLPNDSERIRSYRFLAGALIQDSRTIAIARVLIKGRI